MIYSERTKVTREEWCEYKDLEYYPDRVCACGCGGRIKVHPMHKYHGIPRFIHGHNKSFKGKHHSEESKQKNRKSSLGQLSPKKDKTYEEYYGEEKAGEVKQKMRKPHGLMSEEHKQKIRRAESGPNHYNWQGGIANLPYPFDFNEELKEPIRQRDGVCQLCGKTREENGRKLDVHHIDYIKENLDPNNLIALCWSCNAKVNFNRDYWTEFFQQKLEELKCEVILNQGV